jgi:hypothetical protein
MSVKMRQIVEKEITVTIVDALLKAGFELQVENGDSTSRWMIDRANIIQHLYLTDEDRIYVRKADNSDKTSVFGWVYLVYGNDGWDVLSDYTVNLEKLIGEGTATDKLIERYAD